jgi:hypothetical protein
MLEGGKRLIVRGLVRQVEQYFRLGYCAKTDINLVVWNNDAKAVAWAPDDDLPLDLFDCKNSAHCEALVPLLGEQADDRFIVLTDGFWPDEPGVAIKRWKERLNQSALRIIKVGADANPRLKGPDVFEA